MSAEHTAEGDYIRHACGCINCDARCECEGACAAARPTKVHIHNDEFEALIKAVLLDCGEPLFAIDETVSAVGRIIAARELAALNKGWGLGFKHAREALRTPPGLP
ncbi:hypothetical protein [Nocardioides sp. URHA0032]|uniref:hypothetical protein n=1 Tax=Nocardioides sp. URHA0032 TaxID=1380388 RepID=UPI00048B1175|nr:hypothetical protein [Nocardioides sp. URHA0032]